MMRKSARIFIIFTLLLAGFSHSNAQNTKQQILDQAFTSAKERYFSFPFESKEQLNFLTKIISIDKVEKSTAFAYASRDEFDEFLNTNTHYQLLNHPNTFFNAKMFDARLKQSFAWDQYLTYSDYVDMMYQFAIDFPNICEVFSLGQSVDGREILVAKISDNIGIKEVEPQFLYSGQIHGDELVNSILMLRLIDHLTSNYGQNDQVNHLVDNIEIWINPLANPDGLYAGGNSTVNGATRYNYNAVDLNRNFPDPEDGDHPDGKSWQTETQIFMNLAETQHFVMSANTHSGAEVVNYPWDTWSRLHPDDNWWQLISHEYADLSQLNSPLGYMDGFNDGITNGYAWYSIDGGRQDFMNYFHQCRELTIEQSLQKMVPENELIAHWDYNRQAMLNYLEQVTYGFKGRVTDMNSGNPIQAKIEIDGHDIDNSHVFSDPNGYYYRPIKAGAYKLIFSAEGYESKSVIDQTIADFDSKIINLSLQELNTDIHSEALSNFQIINPAKNNKLQISSPKQIQRIHIYSIIGQHVFTKETNSNELQIDIQNLESGIFILKVDFQNGESFQKRFIKP